MLLSEMTALRGPSGWEDAVRDAIRREAAAILYGKGRVYTDTMGNLFCCRTGTDAGKPRVMLAAHMDEVGFLVRFAREDGLLGIDAVGDIDPRCAVSKHVLVGENAVPGVIGVKAIHLMCEEDRKKAPDLQNMFIDVGAKDREEAERLCPPGSYATFDGAYVPFGDGFVQARALGSRAGCLVLLDALRESDYAGDLTCVFTVQQHVGMRGARIAARRIMPDAAVVVEGAAAGDMVMTDAHRQVARCGAGAVLPFMDRRAVVPQRMRELALRAAQKRGIPVQTLRGTAASSGAGEIERVGAPCLRIAIPCRYAHSPATVCKLSDIDAVRDLLLAVLEEINEGADRV